ncbi:TATA box-binding protein-associated factor RNA polymerase I subunit C isoform X2 [Gymnodraco acuticeps]|uniref:TATA box-binding protein-associated factor RNA polymerase I subunit C isoform X2 n=1 Tax=Gymnodraco acuticeps TaxID=8218 RepID=A0A6P8WFH0_GYMAC|nr:TATA box-binding protein-associated factor RNA polymerase I subunit C isoform X2 [Gymnodraco acuticeps]
MTNTMDYQFPEQLYPSFYNCGPPDLVLKHCAGNWGCYDGVRPQGGSGPLSSWTFTSRHQVRGETWRHTEPAPVPLLPPKHSVLWPSTPPDPQDFPEHMQNFFMDHCQDAFGSMSEILNEDFIFKQGTKKMSRIDSVYMRKMESLIKKGKLKKRPLSFPSKVLNTYGSMLSDVLAAVPPALLGSLLFEELKEQRERMLFSEAATGGALAFVPFSQSSSDSQSGCLLYPGNQGLDCLNFQGVELQQHRGTPPCLNTSSSNLSSFQLKAPVRQISTASLINNCCVAVRSDHLCGVWRFSEGNKPQLMEVVNTKEVATCISVSPHVLGEVLVASESGAVDLWTVGRGMQRVREEEENLYFNAKSSWRWCEFSAHPRVMVYADRTGVELTDIRVSPVSNHTLFRISNTAECRSGERLILSRYLADIHPFHHLITTQHSAYIMDERFPCVHMLKWDHMMQSPPMFCHTFPGSASSRTAKVLLGSHSSQEITLLQYSGGKAEACSSRGPPQALLRPRDSLRHLPVQLPHRLELATSRLSSPAAGLTCIQKRGGGEAGGEECICILQLTEAGDIFYQILEHEQSHTPPPAMEKNTISEINPAQQPPQSLRLISEVSSDEDIIGPTQTQSFVAETQEEERPELDMYAFSNESWSPRKSRRIKNLQLQVIVNDYDNDETVSGLDTGLNEETVSEEKADIPEEPSRVEETTSGSQKLSDGVLVTWKQWLQKLMQKSHKNKPRPQLRQPFKITTKELIYLSSDDEARGEDSEEKERVENVRRDLRACMTNRSLLVHSAVSASLGDQEVVEVPDAVNTDDWGDPTSERFTVSWQGEGAWQAWWVENLGLNREKKVEALRRKRRREKEVRRASSQRSVLSSSFCSSLSYQSDLSDFSDLSGWSSSASLGAWSDSEGGLSQSEGSVGSGIPRAATPSSSQTDPTPQPGNQTPTSQRGNQTPTSQPGNQTPTSQRGNQTPTSQPGNQTPTSQPGNQTPTSQPGNQTPTSQPGNQTPTSQRGNQTPTSQRGNQTPTSQRGNQTPTSQRGNQTPTSQRGNQTPSRTNAPPNTPKPLDSTPATVRRSKPQEDYLSALFAPQVRGRGNDYRSFSSTQKLWWRVRLRFGKAK